MRCPKGPREGSVLNVTNSAFFSSVARGRTFVEMAVPCVRALAGRLLRKRRTDLDFGEKGLTLVATSVMKRVIMMGEPGLDGRAN